MSGWIKLHRSIRENPIGYNPIAFRIWVECLFSATHKDYRIDHGGKERLLKPGEFVFGRHAWAKKLKLNHMTVYRWFAKFLKRGMISVQVRVQGLSTIYKIEKWEQYQLGVQGSVHLGEQPPCNLVSTNKNNKNDKNIPQNKNTNKIKEIFIYWNTKKIIQHRSLTDPMKDCINARLTTDKYTVKEIKTAIDNYHHILNDARFWINYRWSLKEFLLRGLEKMIDLESAKVMYLREGEKVDNSKEVYADIKADNPDFLDR